MNTLMVKELSWGVRVSSDFREKVFEISDRFGWTDRHASWLMACMAFESAETFSPSIKNGAGSGAVGLIQFMPKTAEGLGTSTEALARMVGIEQLEWVARYFKPYVSRIHTLPDMYMAILMPSFIGRPESAILFKQGTKAYTQNKGLDANRDGVVTKLEAARKVNAKLIKGMGEGYVWRA